MKPLPPVCSSGPFLRYDALAAGVTPKVLRGRQFVRLHPRVFVRRAHELTWEDRVRAARLALPDRVHLTGISRLQAAGLDVGPRLPVRFVVQGDHHLQIPGIFLHRTKALPPLDEVGVTPAAAYVFFCARARTIDAIKVGDWLLRETEVTPRLLARLAVAQLWRPGAQEVLWVLPHLDVRSRSLMESELRALLSFGGLPAFDVNVALQLGPDVVTPDLRHPATGVVVEYEGGHHQTDRLQYVADVDRTAVYRRHATPYVQLTREHVARPGSAVRRVHRALCEAGYEGPAPHFGEQWRTLFAPLSQAVGPRTPSWR